MVEIAVHERRKRQHQGKQGHDNIKKTLSKLHVN